MATKCVCVWYDETSEPSAPRWVVSADEIDLATGETETTATIEVLDADATEAQAIEAGKRIATQRGLPLYQFDPATDGYGRGNRHTLIAE